MTTVRLSCQIGTTDQAAELGLEAWIDGLKFFDQDHVTQTQTVCMDINDDEAEHVLRFVMKNKKPEHTKIDEQGNIIQDACITITDLAFDELTLGYIFTKLASYTHDTNGTAEEAGYKFFGEMGCNGTVRLEFNTPIYLWYLEHM